jgi:hypothetical protein
MVVEEESTSSSNNNIDPVNNVLLPIAEENEEDLIADDVFKGDDQLLNAEFEERKQAIKVEREQAHQSMVAQADKMLQASNSR